MAQFIRIRDIIFNLEEISKIEKYHVEKLTYNNDTFFDKKGNFKHDYVANHVGWLCKITSKIRGQHGYFIRKFDFSNESEADQFISDIQKAIGKTLGKDIRTVK